MIQKSWIVFSCISFLPFLIDQFPLESGTGEHVSLIKPRAFL